MDTKKTPKLDPQKAKALLKGAQAAHSNADADAFFEEATDPNRRIAPPVDPSHFSPPKHKR
jgi:hypothetical protein